MRAQTFRDSDTVDRVVVGSGVTYKNHLDDLANARFAQRGEI